MIYACDFDNTLCVDKFPGIGAPNINLIEFLISARKNGDEVILWTCRGAHYLDEAVAWCKEQGLEFDAINEDVARIKNSTFGKDKSAKVYADIYLDDKAEKIVIEGNVPNVPKVTEFLDMFKGINNGYQIST